MEFLYSNHYIWQGFYKKMQILDTVYSVNPHTVTLHDIQNNPRWIIYCMFVSILLKWMSAMPRLRTELATIWLQKLSEVTLHPSAAHSTWHIRKKHFIVYFSNLPQPLWFNIMKYNQKCHRIGIERSSYPREYSILMQCMKLAAYSDVAATLIPWPNYMFN